MTDLPKTFDSAEIEARWYAHWEQNGLFRPERPGAEPWTIVNPPPNVTGSLHIGHALDNTLQDILVRHARLKGKDALWVVGTDHAGIATQMVVERQLAERQDKRTNYSREQFVQKVWQWKAESGGAITRQLRRLGCSMDWANERFTMDEGFSKAVLKVFVDLYDQGLLYRDKRLVNWDPGLGTAISDLEVETREVKGGFWHFRYPLADGVTLPDGTDHLVVATTRPETMLADMLVAVNAADERYQTVIGEHVIQPLTGRRLRIVADDHADPTLGSGVVKITPGHDFNDFEVAKRAGIEPRAMLNMFDAKADVVQTADGLVPAEFIGLHRFKKDGTPGARELVVERMKALGLLVAHLDKEGAEHDAEPRTIQTPFGDRSGVVIEPWLTDQWYVDAATLAKPAIEAVKDGRIKIVPKSWEKTFFNWMENIQPWCVSRQLWWGHRIPAWFADDGRVFVAENADAARALAGDGVALTQDEDVLDTWFSSALWPFATLGWPDRSSPSLLGEGDHAEHGGGAAPGATVAAPPPPSAVPLPEQSSGRNLNGRYPNDVLISGFDILFFWDARMMMQGLHFMGDVPFRTLYLHGLVRAADGQKMSKSKGNTVDPLGLIDKYGADALRFFMAAMESQGRDIKMDERRIEGYRNFATKLWNAARFAQANGIGGSSGVAPPAARLAVNQWIIGETVATVRAVDAALADYRFDGAANAVYHFVWDQFCDWYLELIKPVLQGEEAGEDAAETRAVAGWVLDRILVLLHPFMPFITEELWSKLAEREHELIVARWPEVEGVAVDPRASRDVELLIKVITEIRSARTELNVPPSLKTDGYFLVSEDWVEEWVSFNTTALKRLARLETIHRPANGSFGRPNHPKAPEGARLTLTFAGLVINIPLEGIIDLAAERARLSKAIAAAERERDALAGRLGNPSFVERAKPEAVEKARADHAEKAAEAERLSAALARLG
ncbi:MAG: valine--tRNA ligase [Proteobacteria bacterium SG_bin5]|nr:MAG: valine--tRNA ligase [Proteobacteria bacterium SG_bin5]